MKKQILLTLAVAGLAFSVFQACSESDFTASVSGASVTVTESDGGIVVITPQGDVSRYEYAYGMDMGIDDFLSLPEAERTSVEGDGVTEIDLSLLPPGGYYGFYAVAYDTEGTAGAVSSLTIPLFEEDFKVEMTWVTESTAGFVIYCSGNYASIRYYVGTAGDRDAFLSGEIEGTLVEEPVEYAGVNCFDLEGGTEYVLYAQAVDRSGAEEFKELPFTTCENAGSCSSAEYEMLESDAYRTLFRVTPGGNTVKVAAFAMSESEAYTNNLVMYGPANGRGHLVSVFNNWLSIGFNFETASGVLEFETFDPSLECNVKTVMYIATMDASGNIRGIYRHDLVTSPVDGNAGTAKVSINVSDITSSGATYTYTPNQETMGFFYDTIDADWFDEFRKTPEYNEYYLHNRLFTQGYYWAYGQDEVVYTETTGTPGKRYYAAVCPLNVNGPLNGGWGEMTLVEYTTSVE